jgi:hypothetical protein
MLCYVMLCYVFIVNWCMLCYLCCEVRLTPEVTGKFAVKLGAWSGIGHGQRLHGGQEMRGEMHIIPVNA